MFFFSWKVNVELSLITPGSSVFVICGVASRLVGKKRTRSKCCQKRSNRFLSNQHFKDADNHEHFIIN